MGKRWLYFSDESYIAGKMIGEPPLLDSFPSDFGLTRIEFAEGIKEWIGSIRFVPGFAFYTNRSVPYFYRLHGCQNLRSSPYTKDTCPWMMHVALAHYDFLVNFLSTKFTYRTEFYEYYPTMLTFTQCRKGQKAPKGNAATVLDGRSYLHLFHHTTLEAKSKILEDAFLRASSWNFCGTRRLKKTYIYMTDIPNIASKYDTLPMLMTKSAAHSVLRTDDEEEIVVPPIEFDDRALVERVCLLVSPDIIQPNPMIMHQEIGGQPKWLEIAFPHIYRCPCSGLHLKNSFTIDDESYWIIERDCVADFRTDDPICFANGNDASALMNLIDDCYMPNKT